MSKVSHYVRAVDGRLYRNPVLVFDEGFICFDDDDPPELVIWDHEPPHDPVDTLSRVLGVSGWKTHDRPAYGHGQRVDSDARPVEVSTQFEAGKLRDASWCFFELLARIPVPQEHDGIPLALASELRDIDCVVLDPPA